MNQRFLTTLGGRASSVLRASSRSKIISSSTAAVYLHRCKSSTSTHEEATVDLTTSQAHINRYWKQVTGDTGDPAYIPEKTLPDMSNIPPTEDGIRELLLKAITAKADQGDLVPSLLTQQAIDFYRTLEIPMKAVYLRVLAREFGVDKKHALEAAIEFTKSGTMSDRSAVRAEEVFKSALVAPYQRFFQQVIQLGGGMSWLVSLRADVLGLLAEDNDPWLHAIDGYLKHQLSSWFGVGFLDLERLTWNSPASVLEKVIAYEAVHEIKSWTPHLKQRLSQGRLCYAFFHRAIPLLPLAFVQIALVDKISSSVQTILNDASPNSDPTHHKTAIFYSITSTQRGLSGVDLGNFLIKRVVVEIKKHIPTVDTFCTLSPIPGFRKWLSTQMNQEIGSGARGGLLEASEVSRLVGASGSALDAVKKLNELVSTHDWVKDKSLEELLKPLLLRLCSRYLLLEKKRSFCLDPVGNFHIRNGASIHRLNWMGDTQVKGLVQSFGIMTNYNYIVPEIEANNQRYMHDGIIAVVSTAEGIHPTLQWAVEQSGRKVKIVSLSAPSTSPHL
ncbi:malonyl-CoA decarboxylase [Synchytrium microbalum]|uniref:Malonyl-CoA decarboxylase n=1 Tax=Synchytrium microbalum TaxID=1806994 RepID=A0A507C4I2_9FUNG|nr:malonyl-CoA decarboxylase [Synchytrium microbalum]TPX32443.1 malonyl-CoA decarboxylase [Synchytrium microbalum]